MKASEKVLIIRNAEARTNASVTRVMDALSSSSREVTLLSRSRDKTAPSEITFAYEGKNIVNYILRVEEIPGKGMKNLLNLIKYNFLVYRWLRRNRDKFDMIHVFDFDSGFAVYLFTFFRKLKYVYHIADFFVDSRSIPGFLRKLIRSLEYKVIEKAEATIICTEKRRDQILGAKAKNLIVIHNTPVFSQERPEFITSNDKKGLKIAYVGALDKRRFLREMLEIASEVKDIDLVLAGMGDAIREVEKAAQENSNISYLGKVNYGDTVNIYKSCDLMFAIYDPKVENHKYSAPNKVYEAMYFSKAIVVAKDTGVDQIVKDENMGYLVDFDKEEVKALLISLIGNKADLESKALAARKAYDKYSWPVMKKRLIDLYDKI